MSTISIEYLKNLNNVVERVLPEGVSNGRLLTGDSHKPQCCVENVIDNLTNEIDDLEFSIFDHNINTEQQLDEQVGNVHDKLLGLQLHNRANINMEVPLEQQKDNDNDNDSGYYPKLAAFQSTVFSDALVKTAITRSRETSDKRHKLKLKQLEVEQAKLMTELANFHSIIDNTTATAPGSGGLVLPGSSSGVGSPAKKLYSTNAAAGARYVEVKNRIDQLRMVYSSVDIHDVLCMDDEELGVNINAGGGLMEGGETSVEGLSVALMALLARCSAAINDALDSHDEAREGQSDVEDDRWRAFQRDVYDSIDFAIGSNGNRNLKELEASSAPLESRYAEWRRSMQTEHSKHRQKVKAEGGHRGSVAQWASEEEIGVMQRDRDRDVARDGAAAGDTIDVSLQAYILERYEALNALENLEPQGGGADGELGSGGSSRLHKSVLDQYDAGTAEMLEGHTDEFLDDFTAVSSRVRSVREHFCSGLEDYYSKIYACDRERDAALEEGVSEPVRVCVNVEGAKESSSNEDARAMIRGALDGGLSPQARATLSRVGVRVRYADATADGDGNGAAVTGSTSNQTSARVVDHVYGRLTGRGDPVDETEGPVRCHPDGYAPPVRSPLKPEAVSQEVTESVPIPQYVPAAVSQPVSNESSVTFAADSGNLGSVVEEEEEEEEEEDRVEASNIVLSDWSSPGGTSATAAPTVPRAAPSTAFSLFNIQEGGEEEEGAEEGETQKPTVDDLSVPAAPVSMSVSGGGQSPSTAFSLFNIQEGEEEEEEEGEEEEEEVVSSAPIATNRGNNASSHSSSPSHIMNKRPFT